MCIRDRVWRAYSMVSAPHDEFLEFFSIVVPGGEFTSELSRLQVGDELLVDKTALGYLTLDRFIDGRDLWLLGSGTGIAPFLSILQDFEVWQRFERIVPVSYTHLDVYKRQPLGAIDRSRMNVKGSSLAAGHPFAATGGRIVANLAKLLSVAGEGRGLISICAAGGQGVTCLLYTSRCV